MTNRKYFSYFYGMTFGLWSNKQLILGMSKREVLARYRGSLLGLMWSFVHPIILLCVYTFVFSVIFKIKWGQIHDTHANFAIVVFIGLIVFNVVSECLNRAPNLMGDNRNYVKKVVFPLEILPFTVFLPALVHFALSFVILLIALLISGHMIHLSSFLIPIVLLPLVLITIGFMWILSAIGSYIKDVGQSIPMINILLLFGSPIFYPLSIVPEVFLPIYLLNPLTIAIENLRGLLLFGLFPNPTELAIYIIFSIIIYCSGFFVFTRMRRGFADVL